MHMKWLRLLLVIPLLLLPASPAVAADIPITPPPSCDRDILILPVWKAEGTSSHNEYGWTWLGFTVHADGCVLSGATVVYRIVHLSTDDNDLNPEGGTLTWHVGDMTTKTLYVKVFKDDVVEPDEQFVVKVVCPGSSGISGSAYTRGTILNDDGNTPSSEPVPYNYHCRQ